MFSWFKARTKGVQPVEPSRLTDEGEIWDWDDRMDGHAAKLATLGYRLDRRLSWVPWVWVVSPESETPYRPLVWAEALVFLVPSQFGIEGGRITKLSIKTYSEHGPDCCGAEEMLFRFDGGLKVNRLAGNQRAMTLYRDVMRELS